MEKNEIIIRSKNGESNRSTKHALARCNFIMYNAKCHYVVDVDIKSLLYQLRGPLMKQID